MHDLLFTTADQDYYLPLHRARDAGTAYEPREVPAGWTRAAQNVWTVWTPPGSGRSGQGWKVHVSARFERAQAVLDTVAAICFDERVPFKHLTASLYFLVLHHKHAARVQSGKFCAAYPPDVTAARRLMDRLSAALADEDGPYILTDRRYRGSRTVHYRYGSFARRSLLRPDGTGQPVLEDGHGRLVEDRRGPAFTVPEGIADPFCALPLTAGPDGAGPLTVGGCLFDKLIRYSNAGGSYRGRLAATGRDVFIKEARAHHGLVWDGSTAQDRMRREHATLLAVHELAPGLCPEPLDYFREWEHEFLVTEFIDGTSLPVWAATGNPFVQARAEGARYREYYERCLQVLDELAASLRRLHRAGYVFIDVNPSNVVLDESGHPRLVDFEAASRLGGPLHRMAAPGFAPPAGVPVTDPVMLDDYGLSALALFLLAPLHMPAQRCHDTLMHLRRDLEDCAPVPERLWRLVTRFHPPDPRPDPRPGLQRGLPTPGEVAADPRARLAELRDAVADGLVAMADRSDPDTLFPTVPLGHVTNTLCLAYGTAGVVHALHTAGRELPGGVIGRFRADALRRRGELPPGLHTGSAGVAWVLAELGVLDEAEALLDAASASPLAGARATLGEGTAGLAMAHLALYHRTSDPRHLEVAARLADAIPDGPELIPALGPGDATGLLHGRAGIALFLYYLSRATGDDAHLGRGRRLLDAELSRAVSLPDGALSFSDSATARRAMPYLYAGSAGVLFTAARYLASGPDPALLEVIPQIRRDVTKHVSVQAGLYCGLAGLGFALAEHGDLAGDCQAADGSLRIGTALFKYAVPGPAGIRFHGDRTYRFSADLWSGSAGVLLFLGRLLSGQRDALFTFDAVPAWRERPIAAPGTARG